MFKGISPNPKSHSQGWLFLFVPINMVLLKKSGVWYAGYDEIYYLCKVK